MGINRFRVVGILLVIRFNCRNYSCDCKCHQKQKVGDPTS
nr:MAG TPA: Phospholamban [Caudoviricetes sp.]